MEYGGYLRFVLALLFVLGLIGVLAILLRRFGPGAASLAIRRRGQTRRLQIVEVAAIDARRRLVLVKRDDREHLILLGANTELLIESVPARDAPAEDTAC